MTGLIVTGLSFDQPTCARTGFGRLEAAQVWEKGTRLILSLLIVTILVGLCGGVFRTLLDLRSLLHTELDVALRHLIVSTLTLLAVVEVLKTTMAYFSDGRVRVTFIVDTVLVVMLTEIISRWFSGGEWRQFAMLAGLLMALMLIRIAAVRYSPTGKESHSGTG
jgi:uncharacterized membrane protein (DUF373 family)